MNSATASRLPSFYEEDSNTSGLPFLLLLSALIAPLSYFLLRGSTDGKVYELGGIPLWTAWIFFTKRYDFMQQHLKSIRGAFRFQILQHRVLALTGTEARKSFYNERHFSFSEGFKVLHGGVPLLKDVGKEREEADNTFLKRLHIFMRREHLETNIPLFFKDLHRHMQSLENGSMINPFADVYNLVFQMIVRMSTCASLAENPIKMAQLIECFRNLETSTTPASVLLPWFPSPARNAKGTLTMGLYRLILSFIHERRAAGATTMDPLDVLIREGDADHAIVEFVMIVLFAGISATGQSSCWLLLHLDQNPDWKLRLTDELEAMINKHTDPSSDEPFHLLLSTIPLSGWEDELPIADAVIRETLRLVIANQTAIRRNIGNDVVVDGVDVKAGDFMVYSVAEVHLDHNIYANPEKFDPARYLEGREEGKKVEYSFLGWGAGRRMCAGMRAAKLEMKLLLALFLMGYNYTVVDKNGRPTKVSPNKNDGQARPDGEDAFLKLTRVRN